MGFKGLNYAGLKEISMRERERENTIKENDGQKKTDVEKQNKLENPPKRETKKKQKKLNTTFSSTIICMKL